MHTCTSLSVRISLSTVRLMIRRCQVGAQVRRRTNRRAFRPCRKRAGVGWCCAGEGKIGTSEYTDEYLVKERRQRFGCEREGCGQHFLNEESSDRYRIDCHCFFFSAMCSRTSPPGLGARLRFLGAGLHGSIRYLPGILHAPLALVFLQNPEVTDAPRMSPAGPDPMLPGRTQVLWWMTRSLILLLTTSTALIILRHMIASKLMSSACHQQINRRC